MVANWFGDPAKRPPGAGWRPALESLEDRQVMTATPAVLGVGGTFNVLALAPQGLTAGAAAAQPVGGPAIPAGQSVGGGHVHTTPPVTTQATGAVKAVATPTPDDILFAKIPMADYYAEHIHPTLRIFVNGQEVYLPPDLGNYAYGAFAPIHTHDSSGTLHVEWPTWHDFYLGDFFRFWGRDMSNPDPSGHPLSGPAKVTVTVNGDVVTDPANLLLRDRDNIVLRVEDQAYQQSHANQPFVLPLTPDGVLNQHLNPADPKYHQMWSENSYVNLQVTVNGKAVTIPAGLGAYQDGTVGPISTENNANGFNVHLRAEYMRNFYLGDVFHFWGHDLTNPDPVNNPVHQLGKFTITVNGVDVTKQGGALALRDGDVVKVTIEDAGWQKDPILFQALQTNGQETVHGHATLVVNVNGKNVPVPANLGYDPATGAYLPVRTMDGTGKIHFEYNAGRPFRLGDVFNVWAYWTGTAAPKRTAPTVGYVMMTVNGVPTTAGANTILHDGDQIVLNVRSMAPPPTPYLFTGWRYLIPRSGASLGLWGAA